MKYLGIDFGSKKVGFAQSDDEGRMAFPLMIAPNDEQLATEYAGKAEVAKLDVDNN